MVINRYDVIQLRPGFCMYAKPPLNTPMVNNKRLIYLNKIEGYLQQYGRPRMRSNRAQLLVTTLPAGG